MKNITPGHRYELNNFEPNRGSNDVSKGLRKEAHELCQAIEVCGASPALTHAVILASALGDKIGQLENGNQVIQFIEKVPVHASDCPAAGGIEGKCNCGTQILKTVNNGTTNEEILAVLIDRIGYLNSKFPCKENAVALTHIETALLWLNKRTSDRLARNVEGKHQA